MTGEIDLEKVYEEFHPRILHYLSRLTGHREVEDLAQETFMRAFRALPRFRRDGARPSTWLLTIATRVAIDELRRQRPVPGPVELIPGGDRPDQVFEQRALGARIETAVEALPAMQRAAFVLREYHGLSYDEIARCTETNVGTVRSRLFYARKCVVEAFVAAGYANRFAQASAAAGLAVASASSQSPAGRAPLLST